MRRNNLEAQTSNKAGAHSTAEKSNASRPKSGTSPKSKKVPGASGPGNYSTKSDKRSSHD